MHFWWPLPGVGVPLGVGVGDGLGHGPAASSGWFRKCCSRALQAIVMVWGFALAVWQMVHGWWPLPGVGVGEGGDCAWAMGAVAAQNASVTPATESNAAPKVANRVARKYLLVPEDNVFFIGCFWL